MVNDRNFTKEEAEALEGRMIACREYEDRYAKVVDKLLIREESQEYLIAVVWNENKPGYSWVCGELVSFECLTVEDGYRLLKAAEAKEAEQHWLRTVPPKEWKALDQEQELERMISERAKQIMAELASARKGRGH